MQHRFESFDSLRGLAAITVVLQHFNNDYLLFTAATTPLIYNSILHVFFDGKAAVDFFFVLSGFVLAYKYVKDGFKSINSLDYSAYLIARIFRIYPLAILVVTISAVVALYGHITFAGVPLAGESSKFWDKSFHFSSYLKQICLVRMDNLVGSNYVPQIWTLKLEVIISCIVPILILIARYRVSWLVAFTMLFIVLFQVSPFILLFSMGIILAIYLPQIHTYMVNRSRVFKSLMLLLGIFLYSYRFSVVPYMRQGSFLQNNFGDPWGIFVNLVIGTGVVLILIVTLNSVTLKKILHHRFMLLQGHISYSVYLCHYFFLIAVIPRVVLLLNEHGIYDRNIIIPIALVSTLALTFFTSCLLYFTAEKAGISLGKRVIAAYNSFLIRNKWVAEPKAAS